MTLESTFLSRDELAANGLKHQFVLIAQEGWTADARAFVAGDRPDVYGVFRHLRDDFGIRTVMVDPTPWPLNPFGRMHAFYGGMDPVRTLRILLRMRRADAVVAVFESSPLLLLLLRRLLGFAPPVAIWDIAPNATWKMRQRVSNVVLPRADAIFTLAASQLAYVQQHWRTRAALRAIGQCVDTDFYRPGPPRPGAPILAIGDDGGRDWNGFLQAVAPLEVDVILRTSAAVVLPPGMRCRVTQLKERVSFSALRELYAACSFVVVPVHQTLNVSGVGSVLEAMAMGKALVMNDNRPLADYVVDGETALVTPVGDPPALRAAITRLLADPALAQRLGAAGRARAETAHAIRPFAARLGAELLALFAHRRKQPDQQGS